MSVDPRFAGETPSLTPYLQHEAFARRLAQRLVRDQNLVDDIMQETWLSCLATPSSQVRSPRSWLSRVVRNHATDQHVSDSRRRRREARVAHHGPGEDAEGDAGIELNTGADAAQDSLMEALSMLKPVQREAIELRYLRELSLAQVAERTGAPRETIRSRLKAGLESLRQHLTRKHGAGRGWLLALGPLWLDLAEPLDGASNPAAAGGAHPIVGDRVPAQPAAKMSWLRASPVSLSLAGGLLATIFVVLAARGQTSDPQLAEPLSASYRVSRATNTPKPEDSPSARQPVQSGERRPDSPAQAGVAERRLLVRVRDLQGLPRAAQIWINDGFNNSVLASTTDDDGAAEFTIDESLVGALGLEGLEDKISIHARSEGLVRSSTHFVRTPVGESTQIELTVGPVATWLEGFVHDQQGAPLVGALVTLGRPIPRGVNLDPEHLVYDVPDGYGTEADGFFGFNMTLPGRRPLTVDLAGYAPLRTWVDLKPGEFQEIRLSATRGATLSGVARGLGQEPIPGVRVWAFLPSGSLGARGHIPRETLADEDGRFSLTGLPPGPLRVYAQDPRTPELCSVETIALSAAQEHDWQPRLELQESVTVRVMDHAGGAAPGVEVRLTQVHPDPWSFSTATDARGHATFSALPPGPFSLTATRDSLVQPFPELAMEGVMPGEDIVELNLPSAPGFVKLGGLFASSEQTPFATGRLVLDCAVGVDTFFAYDTANGGFELPSPTGVRSLRFLHPTLGVASLGRHRVEPPLTDLGRLETPAPAVLHLRWRGSEDQSLAVTQLSTASGEVARHHLSTSNASCDEQHTLFPGQYEILVRNSRLEIVQRVQIELVAAGQRELTLETE